MGEKIKVTLRVEILGRNRSLRHNIEVELDMMGLVMSGPLPESSRRNPNEEIFIGTGVSVLDAVISWLNHMNHSPNYLPEYQK